MRKQDQIAPMEWINELFGRFTNIYKTRWTENNPTALIEAATKYEWAKSLYGLSYEQIKATIDLCGKTEGWPPDPPEFRQLALNPYPGRTHHDAYKPFPPCKLLEKPRNKKVGEAAIANIKKILANVIRK